MIIRSVSIGGHALALKALAGRTIRSSWFAAGSGLLAIRVVNTVLGVATTVLLARYMGAAGLGLYVFALTLARLVAVPLHMGLPTLLTREIAAAKRTGRHGLVLGIERWSLAMIGLGSLALLVLVLAAHGLAEALAGWRLTGADLHLALLAAATVPLFALLHRARGILSGHRRVVAAGLPDTLIRPSLLLPLAAVVLLFWATDPVSIMAVHVLAAIVAALVAVWLVHRTRSPQIVAVPPEYDTAAWLRSLAPLTAISAVAVVKNYTDIVMLGLFVDAAEVGYYRVAAQIGTLPLLIQVIGNAILAPRIAASFAAGETAKLQRMAVLASRLTLAPALLFLLAFIAFGRPATLFVFGADYAASFAVTLVLSLGVVVSTSCGATVTFLQMIRNERTTARIAIAAATANVLLNVALVPFYGAVGAAAATVMSLVLMQLSAWRAVRRNTGLRTDAFAPLRRPKAA